jgi:hypothetical protein
MKPPSLAALAFLVVALTLGSAEFDEIGSKSGAQPKSQAFEILTTSIAARERLRFGLAEEWAAIPSSGPPEEAEAIRPAPYHPRPSRVEVEWVCQDFRGQGAVGGAYPGNYRPEGHVQECRWIRVKEH